MILEKQEKESAGTVSTEFTFNTGKAPLIIQRVRASCGCTTPEYTNEPILPRKTGTIKVTYSTTGRPGVFNKDVTIFTNVPDTVYKVKKRSKEKLFVKNNGVIITNIRGYIGRCILFYFNRKNEIVHSLFIINPNIRKHRRTRRYSEENKRIAKGLSGYHQGLQGWLPHYG